MRSRYRIRSMPRSAIVAANGTPDSAVAPSRILGIDTALRHTGAGVVAVDTSRPRLLLYEVIKSPSKHTLSACLLKLENGLHAVIERGQPDVAAIENVFFCRNAETALLLGHARGVAIATCARHGLPVFAYAPRRVKQAVVGYGNAAKSQVQRMVTDLLALSETPPEDAADALALALCHWHSRGRILTGLMEAPL